MGVSSDESAVLHHFLSEHERLVDVATFLLAGVAVTTLLSEIAVVITILAGLASLTLALIRIHDRVKYGRASE